MIVTNSRNAAVTYKVDELNDAPESCVIISGDQMIPNV